MRSLYWKIFFSFWLATILIILTTAWIIGEIAQKSSLPAHEQVFMDSYANAAVVTFESGKQAVLRTWLEQIGNTKEMSLFLLSSTGEIISDGPVPEEIQKISDDLMQSRLNYGLLKFGNLIVSHEVISTSGKAYRLAALTDKPLPSYITIPWAGLTIRLVIAIFISGVICYLLSRYLTQPLRSLSLAAKSLGRGKLNTRVGTFKGHYRDEIANLSADFDRMAEQLETLMHSKERLLQDISHELRSPLARLQIAGELGRKKTQGLADSEFDRIEMECNRLNDLIEEILQFARLDNSSEQLNKTPVNIIQLLQKILDDANFESQNARVNLNADKNWTFLMDERFIYRALENIIRNALHYSPVHEKVTVTLHSNQSDTLVITIQDQGPGVPKKQLKKIFNPFYRVDISREKKTGGYGLGLAIAQKAIFLHQGKITAHNGKKGGFIIEIQLPMAH